MLANKQAPVDRTKLTITNYREKFRRMKLPRCTNQATNRLALVVLATVLVNSPHWLSKLHALSIDTQQQQPARQVDTAAGQTNAIVHLDAPKGPANVAPQPPQPPVTVTTVPQAQTPSAPLQQVQPDTRRPIWSIAHMVNSIKELDYRLSLGANAVETDVTFSISGVPWYNYHGPPCDCWRHCHQQANFNDYLKYVREESIDISDGVGQNLTLLFLDLKLDPLDPISKARAGMELAKSLTENLFLVAQRQLPRQQSFHLIVSVNHVSDIELVRNFVWALERSNASYLLERNIGFDVGMNDDLGQIEMMWRKFAASSGNTMHLNLWQGDGYTNCFSPFYNLERLSRAITKRDSPQAFPAKVYHWTIDLRDRMRESLLMGVDAIMTNHPERVLAVLQEPDMAHEFRIATRYDNPFQKLPRRAGGVARNAGETARYQRSAAQTSSGMGGGFIGTLLDVLNSWLNYVKEIPFLSLPTTLVSKSVTSLKLQKRQAGSAHKSTTTTTTTTAAAAQASTTQKPTVKPPAAVHTITQVRLTPHLEYKVVENATDSTTTTTTTTTTVAADQQRNSADSTNSTTLPSPIDGAQQNTTQQQVQDTRPEYEGPKWYTSLISNMLVSAIKVVLPP